LGAANKGATVPGPTPAAPAAGLSAPASADRSAVAQLDVSQL